MPPAAIVTSVADSVCFTGFLIFSIPDPDPGSASKNLSI
jgi:hypothetical protein